MALIRRSIYGNDIKIIVKPAENDLISPCRDFIMNPPVSRRCFCYTQRDWYSISMKMILLHQIIVWDGIIPRDRRKLHSSSSPSSPEQRLTGVSDPDHLYRVETAGHMLRDLLEIALSLEAVIIAGLILPPVSTGITAFSLILVSRLIISNTFMRFTDLNRSPARRTCISHLSGFLEPI